MDALPSRLFDLVGLLRMAVVKARSAFGTPTQCQAAATLMVYPAAPSMLPQELAATYDTPAVWPKTLTE